MKFLRQIKYEIRNILKSKFLLIIGIIVLAAGILIPVINALSASQTKQDIVYGGYSGKYYAAEKIIYDGGIYGGDPIIVNGITIQPDNPFYSELLWRVEEKARFEGGNYSDYGLTSPAALDLMLELSDVDIDYFLRFAQYITSYNDYRMQLAYMGTSNLYDKFIYEHSDVDQGVLIEVTNFKYYVDPDVLKTKYIDITTAERQAAIMKIDQYLETLTAILENNDFSKYIELSIANQNTQIATLEQNIEIQEQTILDNPSQEEQLSQYIDQMYKEIEIIKTSTIPILEFRLANNIVPGTESWQNNALNEIESNKSQLAYLKILTEEEYNKDPNAGYNGGFYPVLRADIMPVPSSERKTYQEYVDYMQKQIDTCNTAISIAQQSLDSGQPDMKYVPAGARAKTFAYLDYSLIVALFAILLGGWLIASEFQQGTVRLLMIRPKTRIKILFSKFLAAVLIWLFVLVAGNLLNMIVNGIIFGFADFTFPNYTIGGPINFFAFYFPKFLFCIAPILFAFAMAFMLSVLVRNSAVAIAVPIVFFVASLILMQIVPYSVIGNGGNINWLAYTPLPYMQITQFFQTSTMYSYSGISYLQQMGVPLDLTYGVSLFLVLSVAFTAVAAWVFKKRDITN